MSPTPNLTILTSTKPHLVWFFNTVLQLDSIGYVGKMELNFSPVAISGVNLTQSLKPCGETRMVPVGGNLQAVMS